jgi:hypothetical protein
MKFTGAQHCLGKRRGCESHHDGGPRQFESAHVPFLALIENESTSLFWDKFGNFIQWADRLIRHSKGLKVYCCGV